MTEFTYSTNHSTLEATLHVRAIFKDGDLERVEVKHEDEVLIMSSAMFFVVFGGDAHDIYDKAAEAHQNATLA